MNGLTLATAISRYFSWGTAADITDSFGRSIGAIEEEVIRILPWAQYKVFNAHNEYIAVAKMDFLGTAFELQHPENPDEIYATISRPLIRFFFDYWTVQIKNRQIFEDGTIDPRILVILAIYQTDKDNRDRIKRELFNQLQKEQEYNELRHFE